MGRLAPRAGVTGFEVIAVLGTTALFACGAPPSGSSRGSGRASGSPRRGLLLGPLADRAFDQAKGPALATVAVLVVAVVVFWRVRRSRRAAAPGAWMEASCPACIGVTLLAGRVSGLAGLAAPDPVRTEPGDEPKVLVS